MKHIAIIPARSGSKGLKDKNIKELCGKPMMAYTIEEAVQSGVFDCVHVSTDSIKYADIAKKYGADVPFLREMEYATDSASVWGGWASAPDCEAAGAAAGFGAARLESGVDAMLGSLGERISSGMSARSSSPPDERMVIFSIALRSWRTLPGHGYFSSAAIAASVMPVTLLPF